jgi:hypothetical protein
VEEEPAEDAEPATPDAKVEPEPALDAQQ